MTNTPLSDERTADLYEITWMSGHVETVAATTVNFPPDSGHIRIYNDTISGRWTLVLCVSAADIRTIRRVTDGEEVPQS